MFTRRQFLQLTTLSAIGSESAFARMIDFDDWPIDLKSLEPIAHSIFGVRQLELSNQFEIGHGWRETRENSQIPNKKCDRRGVVIHIPEDGFRVPIIVRKIVTAKLALVLDKYGDQKPETIAVVRFNTRAVDEIRIPINLMGFTSRWERLNRVWALAENNGRVLCVCGNILFRWSCDGC